VDVLVTHAELGEQALGVLERAGVEPSFYLGVERVVQWSQRSTRVARA
jgi:hypothetical protein